MSVALVPSSKPLSFAKPERHELHDIFTQHVQCKTRRGTTTGARGYIEHGGRNYQVTRYSVLGRVQHDLQRSATLGHSWLNAIANLYFHMVRNTASARLQLAQAKHDLETEIAARQARTIMGPLNAACELESFRDFGPAPAGSCYSASEAKYDANTIARMNVDARDYYACRDELRSVNPRRRLDDAGYTTGSLTTGYQQPTFRLYRKMEPGADGKGVPLSAEDAAKLSDGRLIQLRSGDLLESEFSRAMNPEQTYAVQVLEQEIESLEAALQERQSLVERLGSLCTPASPDEWTALPQAEIDARLKERMDGNTGEIVQLGVKLSKLDDESVYQAQISECLAKKGEIEASFLVELKKFATLTWEDPANGGLTVAQKRFLTAAVDEIWMTMLAVDEVITACPGMSSRITPEVSKAWAVTSKAYCQALGVPFNASARDNQYILEATTAVQARVKELRSNLGVRDYFADILCNNDSHWRNSMSREEFVEVKRVFRTIKLTL